ncbi:hypothetical protein [Sphingomonas humi]|uniref:hypothetical protein n=1 Tax=Sphingomonas humi TaxID=335630 RepID=UPI0031DFC0D2
MAEGVKRLQAAVALKGEELGAVLANLGPHGDDSDRLAAVVALLANQASSSTKMVRGAFAGITTKATATKVSRAFTSALHGCLREQPVNAPSPATTRSV